MMNNFHLIENITILSAFFRTFTQASENPLNMDKNNKDLNRLKLVLVEKKLTNKWLAEQLGKDPATVSKWCTNSSQPGLETLFKISELLEVDVKELLCTPKSE